MRKLSFAILIGSLLGFSCTALADLPLGASCKNSNQCATKRCAENKCKTHRGTTTYYADGANCRYSGECASNKCINSTCGGPKARAAKGNDGGSKSSSSGGGSSGMGGPSLSGNLIEPETKTKCGKDLVDQGYETDPQLGWLNAESTCHYLTAVQIEKAKKLKDSGAVLTFSHATTMAQLTPKQYECAMKEYATTSEADKKSEDWTVSENCRGKK